MFAIWSRYGVLPKTPPFGIVIELDYYLLLSRNIWVWLHLVLSEYILPAPELGLHACIPAPELDYIYTIPALIRLSELATSILPALIQSWTTSILPALIQIIWAGLHLYYLLFSRAGLPALIQIIRARLHLYYTCSYSNRLVITQANITDSRFSQCFKNGWQQVLHWCPRNHITLREKGGNSQIKINYLSGYILDPRVSSAGRGLTTWGAWWGRRHGNKTWMHYSTLWWPFPLVKPLSLPPRGMKHSFWRIRYVSARSGLGTQLLPVQSCLLTCALVSCVLDKPLECMFSEEPGLTWR